MRMFPSICVLAFLVVFLAIIVFVGLVANEYEIGSIIGISSLCSTGSSNATHVFHPTRETENLQAGIQLPPHICQTLSNDGLHRKHAPSPELSRLDNQYALSANILRTGFVRGRLQPDLLQKIANGEPITILTLGNSFTRGHGCGETEFQDEMECSWPARFERWWQSYFLPGISSNFVHHAEHGATSVIALQRLGVVIGGMPQPPDLILLDFLVTDVVTPDSDIGTIGCESLIRTAMELVPKAQIMLFEAGCRNCINSQYVLHRRRQLARQYNIPVVDFAAMVEFHNRPGPANKFKRGSDLDRLWPTQDPELNGPFIVVGKEWPNFQPMLNTTKGVCCPNNHPPWPVHQYVSDSFAFVFMELLKEQGNCQNEEDGSIRKPFHTPEELDKYPSCTEPLVWHDALAAQNRSNGSGIGPSTLRGKWRLFEDKPGRPGWITTELGSAISFPIRFSRVRPVLAITYLRSYANLGIVQVNFTAHSGKSNTVTLDGRWSKNFSLPDTAFFIDRPDGINGNLLGDALESDGYTLYDWGDVAKDTSTVEDYSIEITLVAGDKFKITQVMSC